MEVLRPQVMKIVILDSVGEADNVCRIVAQPGRFCFILPRLARGVGELVAIC